MEIKELWNNVCPKEKDLWVDIGPCGKKLKLMLTTTEWTILKWTLQPQSNLSDDCTGHGLDLQNTQDQDTKPPFQIPDLQKLT